MADIKIGDIAVYEDDDGKAVWEFEGKVQSDIPLDTDAQDFAGAINELKKLSEAGGGDDWQPPKDWLEVPEPGEWEANFLIEIRNIPTFYLWLLHPKTGEHGYGNVTVNWGDGTVETYEGCSPDDWPQTPRRSEYHSHTYSESGQYIVKVLADEFSCFLNRVRDKNYGSQSVNLLIAKTGKNICLVNVPDDPSGWRSSDGTFGYNFRLRWVKINGSSQMQQNGFNNCTSLKRLDLAEPMREVPKFCFQLTSVPRNFDFFKIQKIDEYGFSQAILPSEIILPECTEMGKRSFNYCTAEEVSAPKCAKVADYAFSSNRYLKIFSAPLCTSAGGYSFEGCSSLEASEFSDDCVYGTNCFYNCYSLYPRPDGSTN